MDEERKDGRRITVNCPRCDHTFELLASMFMLTCLRCGHTWLPRSDDVGQCPCCHSVRWDKPMTLHEAYSRSDRLAERSRSGITIYVYDTGTGKYFVSLTEKPEHKKLAVLKGRRER